MYKHISFKRLAKQMGITPRILAAQIADGTLPFGDILRGHKVVIYDDIFANWLRGLDITRDIANV